MIDDVQHGYKCRERDETENPPAAMQLMQHLLICNAESSQDKEHEEKGKNTHGQGIIFAICVVTQKQRGQHRVRRSDAANKQTGCNIKNSTKIPLLRTPECYENIRKGGCKYSDTLIKIPEIQKKQPNQIDTDNQHHGNNSAGPPLDNRFAEIDQKNHKAAQKGLRDRNIEGVIKI